MTTIPLGAVSFELAKLHGEFFEGGIVKERNKFARQVAKYVLKRSPVDTGRFKANWTASKGQVSGEYRKEDREQTAVGTFSGATYTAMTTKINSVRTPFTQIWIFNLAPYAEIIDQGLFPSYNSEKVTRGFSNMALEGVIDIAIRDATEGL